MMPFKRGDVKWDVLAIILLSLIVFSLIIYFLFQEYFEDDLIDNEVCRESVLLRSNLGEIGSTSFTYKSFKNEYPLKCKTQHSVIDFEDVERAERLVAENIAGCWYLFGKGRLNPFPSGFVGFNSYCVPCARVTISPEYKDYYKENKIDIQRALNMEFKSGSFLDYLNDDSDSFPAFSIAGAMPFKFNSEFFKVDDEDEDEVVLHDTLNGASESAGVTQIYLPKIFDPDAGDLVIVLDFLVSSNDAEDFGFVPFLFFYQTGSKTDIYEESNKMVVNGPFWFNGELCNKWEGIPA